MVDGKAMAGWRMRKIGICDRKNDSGKAVGFGAGDCSASWGDGTCQKAVDEGEDVESTFVGKPS